MFSERKELIKQVLVTVACLFAIFQVGRSIKDSLERQIFLHKQTLALKAGQKQAQDVNKELRDGLTSYRSTTGIERLARERLNLAASDEVILRIAK